MERKDKSNSDRDRKFSTNKKEALTRSDRFLRNVQEGADAANAISRNCECLREKTGELLKECSLHIMWRTDKDAFKRWVSVRRDPRFQIPKQGR